VRVKIAIPGVSIGLNSSPSSAIKFASNFSSGLSVVVTKGVVVLSLSVVDPVVGAEEVDLALVLLEGGC